MSIIKSKISISVIAIHYSKNDVLQNFLSNVNFADSIQIINLTDEQIESTNKNTNIVNPLENAIEIAILESLATIKSDWILFLKTNYILPKELVNEIQKNVLTLKYGAFCIEKEFVFCGKKMNYGIIEKGEEFYLFRSINADLFLKNDSNHNNLAKNKTQSKLINTAYSDFDNYTKELSIFNKIEIEKLTKKGVQPTIFSLLFQPFSFFLYHYFIKLGFLDGKAGFILVYLHSFNKLRIQLQIWLNNKKIKQ